jgi:mRNA interferase YafQ
METNGKTAVNYVGGDFLLVYRIESLSKFDMIVFVRAGTHSELF